MLTVAQKHTKRASRRNQVHAEKLSRAPVRRETCVVIAPNFKPINPDAPLPKFMESTHPKPVLPSVIRGRNLRMAMLGSLLSFRRGKT